jgi:hypothetical protein
MARGLSPAACMAVVTCLSVLAAVGVYGLAYRIWMAGAMAVVALIAFLWHLEENGEIVIRPDDQVSLFQLREPASAFQPSLHREEGVA